jgi:aryl-alcohol dehydrogenase-like predicted oxidoreductase
MRKLNELAHSRTHALASLALAWVLRPKRKTSVLGSANRVSRTEEDVGALGNLQFTDKELENIKGVQTAQECSSRRGFSHEVPRRSIATDPLPTKE